MPRRNLELKARDRDPSRSLKVCESLGAEEQGLLLQQDTYFEVPRGRLKLRRESDATAQLISYERRDLPGQRESRFRIVEVAEPTELEGALKATLGIKVVVSKQRRLFLLGDVRIHLDLVVDLGDFIEFEAVGGHTDPARFEDVLSGLCSSFGIEDADLVAGSYSDLSA